MYGDYWILGDSLPYLTSRGTAKTSIYDIPYFVTDNKKVTKTYKWKPQKNIFDIVNDTYNWLSKNKSILLKYF